MAIDSERIFKRLEQDTQRGSHTLYLETELWDRFKAFCHQRGVSAARFIEELMREALDGTQSKKIQDKR